MTVPIAAVPMTGDADMTDIGDVRSRPGALYVCCVWLVKALVATVLWATDVVVVFPGAGLGILGVESNIATWLLAEADGGSRIIP
jgi:hypothetical protein